MIRSMTAFARLSSNARDGNWLVEIRSLNHRYYEFSIKSPPAIYAFESRIREMSKSLLKRGKVTITISRADAEDTVQGLSINEEAVRFYVTAFRRLQKKFHLEGAVSVGDMVHLPKIFFQDRPVGDPEEIWPQLSRVLKRVLEQTVRVKELEGRKLSRDIRMRLESMERTVRKIERHAKTHSGRLLRKLSARVKALIGESGLELDRLHREVAYLAERSDITEEIIRIKSHVGLFKKRLGQSAEVGRELDFLCQELHREVNTLGAKAQFFEISTAVVFMKRELEKIREQVQNIE